MSLLILALNLAVILSTLRIGLNWALPTLTLAASAVLLAVLHFESRQNSAKTVALLAVLVGFNVAARQLIHGLGGATPVFLLVVCSGYVFGPLSGFLVGSLTMLVSNITLGQGPWTPLQMLALGLVGWGASWVPKTRSKRMGLLALTVYGFLSGLFYGAVTDLFFWTAFIPEHTLATFAGVWAAGLPMDLARAASTAALVLALARPVARILGRFEQKLSLEHLD